MKAIKTLLENNIRTAIADYRRHTYDTDVLDDVSEAFIERLAGDAIDGKQELRELFRKSQGWDENLQAIVINGNKTHNPDFALVQKLATSILAPANLTFDLEKQALVERAIYFFSRPNDDFADDYIAAIKELAPNAYAPRKKQSRIFKALCDALGVTDNSAGSQFQSLFAQLADEINGKQLDFKLFMSINPAHFITMSNPKRDRRGTMLTSCHSFNSTEYEYNNGCSGYARDGVTFIVFTVADPDVAETLNNRKTSRQLFMYKPYNGLLLQSRLYNTHGGTRGEQEESKLYRDLVQRELSELEGIPNLWKTENYSGNKRGIYIEADYGFGGYCDWNFSEFNPKISVHENHREDFETFTVGIYGLCICCGEETSEGLYCEYCDNDESEICDECEERCDSTTTVINEYGERIEVCDSCLEDGYRFCPHCDEYYSRDTMTVVGNNYVCERCLAEYYAQCYECDEYQHRDELHSVINQSGEEVMVCEECRYNYYEHCDCCQNVCHEDIMTGVHVRDTDNQIRVCDDCRENYYEECETCGEIFHNDFVSDGLCPNCRQDEEDDTND